MARRRWRGARVKVFHCLLGRLHLFLLSLFSRLPVRAFIRPLRAINERRRSFILSPTSAVDARACAPPAASQARSVLRALRVWLGSDCFFAAVFSSFYYLSALSPHTHRTVDRRRRRRGTSFSAPFGFIRYILLMCEQTTATCPCGRTKLGQSSARPIAHAGPVKITRTATNGTT